MHERALLLGVGLGREDHVGVLAHRVGQRRGVRDHELRLAQRGLPARPVRQLPHGIGVQEVEHAEVAVGERGRQRGPGQRAARDVRVAGAVGGREARLADAAAVGGGGELEQAGAVVAGQAQARGDVEQRPRRLGPARAGEQPLAVDDHDVGARAGEELGQLAHGARVRSGRRGRAAEVALVARERGVEPDEQGLGGAGRVAQHGLGVRVERARARARHGQADAAPAHALAQPQVEDRRVVDRVALEHEHGVGELQVGHARLQRGPGQRARQIRVELARGDARPGEPTRGPRGTGAGGGRPPRSWCRRPPAPRPCRPPWRAPSPRGRAPSPSSPASAARPRAPAARRSARRRAWTGRRSGPCRTASRRRRPRCRARARASRGRRAPSARRCTGPRSTCRPCPRPRCPTGARGSGRPSR